MTHTKLITCRPAPWNVPMKYLTDYYQENSERCLTYLRKLPLTLSPSSLAAMTKTKTVRIVTGVGIENVTRSFELANDGEYYDAKKSLTDFLLGLHKSNEDHGTEKLKLEIY